MNRLPRKRDDADRLQRHGTGTSDCQKIIEVMQGTIDYTSEKEKGTTFVIRLPFQVDKKKEQYTVQDEEAKTVVLDGMKVLLAEDNVLNMEIADFICENEGMIVTKAWNGKEALELFEQAEPGTFDIILMDLMMPVMSGLETAKISGRFSGRMQRRYQS